MMPIALIYLPTTSPVAEDSDDLCVAHGLLAGILLGCLVWVPIGWVVWVLV